MAKKNREKKFRMRDADVQMLDALQGELTRHGITVSQSDIIALGLKKIQASGGLLKALQEEADEASDTRRAG